MIGRSSMSSDLYKFKLVSYGKSEGLKHAKQFVANGATKKGVCDKLDKEADFICVSLTKFGSLKLMKWTTPTQTIF